jgi:C-terminal processing protease CtpA/Prc
VLPNEWEFGLSNEIYLDTKGNNYEAIGIPPNIEVNYSKDKQKFLPKIVNSLGTKGDEAINIVLDKY